MKKLIFSPEKFSDASSSPMISTELAAQIAQEIYNDFMTDQPLMFTRFVGANGYKGWLAGQTRAEMDTHLARLVLWSELDHKNFRKKRVRSSE